jgi:hypothetical protein
MNARIRSAATTVMTLTVLGHARPATASGWVQLSTTGQPVADRAGLGVPSGGNALIAASEDQTYGGRFDLQVLGESTDAEGNHHMNSLAPVSSGGALKYQWTSSSQYYNGISASSNGSPQWFGWTLRGYLYDNDVPLYDQVVLQSMAFVEAETTSISSTPIFGLEKTQCGSIGSSHGSGPTPMVGIPQMATDVRSEPTSPNRLARVVGADHAEQTRRTPPHPGRKYRPEF